MISLKYREVILQTDGENAMQSAARQMATGAIPTVTLRTTPRYAHEFNGRVEGVNKTLAGTMRTIKCALDKKCTMALDWGKCSLPWLVRHCAWTLTRYRALQDGHTAFFRLTGARCRR